MYLIRLDDASEYMDAEKWDRIENLLDRFNIKPIVGIIPDNEDESIIGKFIKDIGFWDKAKTWQAKDWSIALHGYNHVCSTNTGGINPIQFRSEFAGVPLEVQKKKISCGIQVLKKHGLNLKVFFAPSHTFDENTLKALLTETDIRIISDTIANDIYKLGEFYFIPQQSGRVRLLPFKTATFCYHPNNMNETDFKVLEEFFLKHREKIGSIQELTFNDRKISLYDMLLRKMYFYIRYFRRKLRKSFSRR